MPPKIKYPYEFDPKIRKKADEYRAGRRYNFLIFAGLYFAVMGIVAVSGFSSWLASVLPYPWHVQAVLYYTVLFLITAAVYFLPLFYFHYIYEKRFNLTRQKVTAWFADYAKYTALSFVVGVVTALALYAILPLPGWWIYALAAYLAGSLVLNYVFPYIVTPLFYKLKPYKDGAHHKKIISILRYAGVSDIKHVYVANESQRSVKANAFFAGFGSSKQVVLFDTLTDNFTNDEVETVIGHELGHYVNKDIWKDIAETFLRMVVVVFAVDLVLGIAGQPINSIALFPLILLVHHFISLASMPLINYHSRRQEKAADIFALETVRKPKAQISAEKRLADSSLSEMHPHPLAYLWTYSHPKILDRIKFCEDWVKKTLAL